VNFHLDIPAAYLWGLATPFIAYAVYWIVCMCLLAIYGWLVNR
jgi:hypothetical protein